MHEVIGREAEIKTLSNRLESKEAEFIALYGRRRVGKTFLIKNVVTNYKCMFLEVSGIKNGSLKEQLANFVEAIAKTFHISLISQTPKNWKEAFNLLTQELSRLGKDQKVVIFLDELPWLATPKSKLVQQLDYYWNNIWSSMPQFKLIVCGSAASWMLEKLIHAKGGLYNRITKTILLKPFSLSETEKFLHSRRVKLNRAQILEIYMVMGGIPHYLKNIEPAKSAIQNINQICFTEDGILYNEFLRLFESLFETANQHEDIIKAIASKLYGISRGEILQATGMVSGGKFDKIINELEASGFIKKFIPYNKSAKEQYFKIVDEYTMFYLKWIAPIKAKSLAIKSNYWQTQSKTPGWQSWAGYAYESICYKHIEQILKKLDLMNIGCIIGNWRHIAKPGELQSGGQIDLLFDRDDNIITICEIKYNDSEFVIDKKYALEIITRNDIFVNQVKTKKQLFTCFITKEKLKENVWADEIVSQNVVSDDLFT